MSCYCDYEPAQFYWARTPKARKQYRCYDCGGTIDPGERYERVTGKWDYGIDVFVTCARCVNLRVWVRNNVPCFCYMHGGLDETAREAIDDAYDRAPEEVVGLRFGYLRRKLVRDKHNEAHK